MKSENPDNDLLFEIGCEEIPAPQLAKQLADLPKLVEDRLAAARLTHAGVRAIGTPRRIAIIVKQLADRQPDINEEVVGPPISAAFAADGTVTKAGQGFAAKNGVDPAALQNKEVAGKKGHYAVALRHIVGQDTRALLPALLTELAGALVWPKSQRWGWSETKFVRPVQWLVALFGGEVVPLTWAQLSSGRTSRGHRFLSPGPVEIASPDRYVEALRAAHVVVDPDDRRTAVRAELARLESETGLEIREDQALLDEVIHLGEYPVGVWGQFDPSYLEVPEEMIVTAMRNHQRYFAMQDASGKLANRFATMMATIVKDPAVVAKGNEKVLAARLSDAKFFFAEDRKKSFEHWNEKLQSVVFQAKLPQGARTIGNKIGRIRQFVSGYADSLARSSASFDAQAARRAAELCKADLSSSAVGEFPELQGVMGKHYATIAGESEAVALAIEEHWWPKGQGAALPTSAVGALVAVADKLDTIVSSFAVGLVPSGSADPYGLRRAALGTISILLDRSRGGDHATPGWPEDLGPLIQTAVNILEADGVIANAAIRKIWEDVRAFFKERLRNFLIGEGFATRHVDAVLGVSASPCDARARARAVAVVPDSACVVFKRIANILDQSHEKGVPYSGIVDPTMLAADVERALWDAFTKQQPVLENALSKGDYATAFTTLAGLGPFVSGFLGEKANEGVMVLDPKNPVLSGNRLSLLDSIRLPYAGIVDFRLLA